MSGNLSLSKLKEGPARVVRIAFHLLTSNILVALSSKFFMYADNVSGRSFIAWTCEP